MRLVDKIKGRADKETRGNAPLGPENGSGVAYSPDGEVYETLQGEPPVATSKGWGDLSWRYLHQRR